MYNMCMIRKIITFTYAIEQKNLVLFFIKIENLENYKYYIL